MSERQPPPTNMFLCRYGKSARPFWLLRFRYNSKIIHRENFYDDFFGSNEAARVAAIRKRDRIAQNVGVDLAKAWFDCKKKKYRYTNRPGKRNTTGVSGVTYYEAGDLRYYKAAICFQKYREKVKSFSCEKLGDAEALRQAIKQRREWENQLIGARHDKKHKDRPTDRKPGLLPVR